MTDAWEAHRQARFAYELSPSDLNERYLIQTFAAWSAEMDPGHGYEHTEDFKKRLREQRQKLSG